MRIIEIPITLYKDGRDRRSHLKSWSDGWRHLRFMLLYSPKWLFMVPGLFCMTLGFLGNFILSFGMFQIGNIVLGANSFVVSSMLFVMGLQLILFAFFTKVYAISEGLMPEDLRLKRINKYLNLETGILTGFILFLSGLALLFTALWYWKSYQFGPIPFFESLRITIPAMTLLVAGVQVIFSSFFLSILGLKHKI